MLEFLAELLFNILLAYPGAFIRWMFGGFRKKYSYYLNDPHTELNTFIGIILLTIIVLIIVV